MHNGANPQILRILFRQFFNQTWRKLLHGTRASGDCVPVPSDQKIFSGDCVPVPSDQKIF